MDCAYRRTVSTTRDRALRAAVDEVGEHGIRSLTHARVDARAGLPKGSTSNWFRTRAALVAGLVAFIAESERNDASSGASPAITTETQLVDRLCELIHVLTTTQAARTRVRFALFLEAAHDRETLAPLLQQRQAFVEWATGLLRDIGARHPDDAARTLLACGNGLVFHRLTVDADAEIRPIIERTVRACMQ
jgi:DNA-binding transcriptional regulator YbjK